MTAEAVGRFDLFADHEQALIALGLAFIGLRSNNPDVQTAVAELMTEVGEKLSHLIDDPEFDETLASLRELAN